MPITIYEDYQDEPEDVFLPLPEELGSELYALEMEDFTEDCRFFANTLSGEGRILEMGCGTGRVARYLASASRPCSGIDISLPMLRRAAGYRHPHCAFFCMDMLVPTFRQPFAALLIPYNTLNLLASSEKILACLKACRGLLQPGGRLILQIFIPDEEFLAGGRTTFQFQMFNRPGGGRVIKEILKKYRAETQTLSLEERYRLRPMQQGRANEDYHRISSIAAFPLESWLALFAQAGLIPRQLYGDYAGAPYAASTSCCLPVLQPR